MSDSVCPVIRAFLFSWNASADDDFLQKLKPFSGSVIGTAGDGHTEARLWMETDWYVRVCAPAWLDLAKHTEHASALRAVQPITSEASAIATQPVIDAAANLQAELAEEMAKKAAFAHLVAGTFVRMLGWELEEGNFGMTPAMIKVWSAAHLAATSATMTAWLMARDCEERKPATEWMKTSMLDLLERMIAGPF